MLQALREIIKDEKRVFVEAIDEKYYSDHLNRIRVKPAAVVIPKSTEEVSEIVKFANAHQVPVIPRGANTGLTGATIPVQGSIVIDLTALNEIGELDQETFTLTVGAGVLLEDIQAFVEDKGLFYPPDPGEKTATIGGNMSTNAGGMRAVKYGVTRDYVRSLEVVLASGEILQLGANTIKNSSGLAIKELIIGSEGTLGIITKACLKVIPKPKHIVSALVPFNNLEEGIDTVIKIIGAGIDVTAIEFIEKKAIRLSEEYLGFDFPSQKGNAYLLLTFDGEDFSTIIKNYTYAKILCEENGGLEFLLLENEESYQKVWQIRGSIVTAIEAKYEQEPIDVVVPINKSAEFVKYTKDVSCRYGLDIQSFGHAGDGNVHLCVIRGELSQEEWDTRLSLALEAIYEKAHLLRGLPSGEHGIGLTKKKYFLQYADEKEIELMKSLKYAFDPKGILNPHKVF